MGRSSRSKARDGELRDRELASEGHPWRGRAPLPLRAQPEARFGAYIKCESIRISLGALWSNLESYHLEMPLSRCLTHPGQT